MLTVQIGQCGNQLGRALFDKLAHEEEAHVRHGDNAPSSFFRPAAASGSASSQRIARAVLIDMEPKVVQQCLRPSSSSSTCTWTYEPSNTFTMQSGSGNNWAYGYTTHGTQHEDALLDVLRREVERCDLVHSFLTLQSVAGGTGSGLGSFLTECMADAFPCAALLNAAVWPHASGEVIVQNYNALLTMATLAQVVDGILVLPNDHAHAICQKVLRIARPSFDDMNDVLATQLAAVLLPVRPMDTSSNSNSNNSHQQQQQHITKPMDCIMELCRQLCAHPGYKLLDIKSIPQMPTRSKQFSTHTWSGVLKHLHQMQVANSPLEEGIDWQISLASEQGRSWNRAVASMLLVRGKDAFSADISAFRHPAMYAPWSLEPFTVFYSSHAFNSYDKSATLVSNSKALVPTLASTVDKAYDMFSHGAYTHQYASHGVEDAFFQEAFVRIDQIVANYQAL